MSETATPTTTAALLVAGTIAGSWESPAALLLGLPRADIRQLPKWPSLLERGQRLIGFVDSPVQALAVALPPGRDADPVPLLDAWCAAAQQALRLAQQYPGQCLLLDVDEILRHPAAATTACAIHLGTPFEAPTVQPTGHDALRLMVAHVATGQHRRARLIGEELMASCTPLEPVTDGTVTEAFGQPGLVLAMARLVELEAVAARAPAQAARVDELLRLRTEAVRDRDAARAEVVTKERGEAAALAQLHQTQGELEALLQRQATLEGELVCRNAEQLQADEVALGRIRAAETALNDVGCRHAEATALATALKVELAEYRTAAEQRHVGAVEQIASLQAELTQSRTAHEAVQREAAAREASRAADLNEAAALTAGLQDELARCRAAAAAEADAREAAERESLRVSALRAAELKRAVESERQLLLVQLHQVQEELERYYLENERLASTVAEPLAAAIRVDRLVPGLVRDEAPHRELNLNLQRVQLPRGEWADIPVRLLDHHGHAGLAIFVTEEQRPPLSAWASSGREGDRPFMLFVPSDANTRAAFDTLSASDWRLVQAVAAHLAHHVAERQAALAPRWSATAARLQLELAALPERWRHDHAEVRNAAEAGRIAIELDNVGLPGRVAEHLSILWTPGRRGDGGGLLLALPEGVSPPLTAWPVGDDGRASTAWDLLPAGVPPAERLRLWRQLPKADRAWLQTMLDALPGLIGSSAEHRGFVAQAQALAAFARHAAQSPRWRRIARRLLGRTDR